MIINADARRIPIADNTIQVCVTSPPYYNLRDYNVANQIGLEQTPDEYIANIVAVSEEVRRVLKPDGVYFINIGDSYHGGGSTTRRGQDTSLYIENSAIAGTYTEGMSGRPVKMRDYCGYKPKSLMMIPARVAIALQAAGWYLRAEIVWAKPNPMPESVTDRPTRSHEMIYLLTKSKRYFYDYEAVREVVAAGRNGSSFTDERDIATKPGLGMKARGGGFSRNYAEAQPAHGAMNLERPPDNGYRNQRDVWTLTTEPYSGAHYAVFPTEIPRRAIKAGSRAGDIVLDPFAGSCTTGIVCRELGRRFIGLDLSMEYLREHGLPRAERKQTQESLERLPLFEVSQ